ncbi:MAG: 4Fe-4S ferredoxin iron-sulfur binding domain protein [Bacteroidetes bacterium]|nr:4Fe-4S ferredoxin iron-sulfur binding domain protein [Bacteroidota bacterium]
MSSIKNIRVFIAIVVFILASVIFLDFTSSIPASWSSGFVALQLVPSLTKLFTGLTLTSLGLVFVLLLTLLLGRVYCSTICPLGTLQDIVIRLTSRMKLKKWYRYKKAPLLVHYGLLAVSVVSAFAGSMILVDLLEPFSNFGRILTNLADPVVVSINNATAFILGRFGIFSLYHVPLIHLQMIVLLYTLAFLAFIVYLSAQHGRLFCNMLCPAGALLGLLSKLSLYKITIIEERCTDCGFCEMVCKANCIDSEAKKIDFHACVGCFNCIDSCPTVGLTFEGFWKQKPVAMLEPVDARRRAFLGALVATSAAIIVPADSTKSGGTPNQVSYDNSRWLPITPPGSHGRERFSNLCTACQLCVSVCPTQVLTPSLLEYGIAGLMQPKMNYSASSCNYECVMCTQVCPTGAILPLDPPAKKEVQLGKAAFVKDDCIVITKKKDCGACSEHCPTKAVKMVPYEGKLLLPELNNDICVGCGACEHPCPTTPKKAIYVVANPVHLKAKKPQVLKLEIPLENQKEFPF